MCRCRGGWGQVFDKVGGIKREKIVHTWFAVVLEPGRGWLALSGSCYSTGKVKREVGVDGQLEQGVGFVGVLLGNEPASLVEGLYEEVFVRG